MPNIAHKDDIDSSNLCPACTSAPDQEVAHGSLPHAPYVARMIPHMEDSDLQDCRSWSVDETVLLQL